MLFLLLLALFSRQDPVFPCSEVKVFKENSITSRKVSIGITVDTLHTGVLTLYNYDTKTKDRIWLSLTNCEKDFAEMDRLRRLKYSTYKDGEETVVVLLFDEVNLQAAAVTTKDGMVVFIIDIRKNKRG